MLKRLGAVLLALAFATPALAQVDFPTTQAGINARAVVIMCLNGSGIAVPATSAGVCLGSGGGGGGGAVTVADGADVTLGALANAAWTTGNGTVVSVLKAIDRDILLSTVAIGSPFQAGGSIGNTTFASTIADGADVTLGAIANAAWTTGNGTVISVLKAIDRDILGPIPAGTNSIGTVVLTAETTKVIGTVNQGTSPWAIRQSSQYPVGATPITISGTGTTGATTATLATGSSITTYICGFSIRANATAAATGNATVTGTITGTLNFTQWTAPNASGLGVTEMIFSPCVPASAVNTGIAVISAAPGTGGVVSVTAWGFTL